MTTNSNGIPLTRLYGKTSARGNRYFVGRLGNARILVFQDAKAEGNDPVWEVFLADVAPSPQKQAQDAPKASEATSTRPRRRNAPAAPKSAPIGGDWQAPVQDPLNDPVPW